MTIAFLLRNALQAASYHAELASMFADLRGGEAT